MRPLAVILCAALLASAPVCPAHGAEAQPRAQAGAQAKAKTKAPRRAKAAAPRSAPVVSREDMLAPYSALRREIAGPPRELAGDTGAGQDRVQSNATSWKVEPSLTARPRDDGSPVQFRFGQDKVVDPLTGKELTPRADPLGAKQSLQDLNLKGALDKLGGKAEVQVDVLKF